MTPTSPAAKPAANQFETMETLVAIGLLDQGTLDAAKAKAGVAPEAPKADPRKGPQASQAIQKMASDKSKAKASTQKIDPNCIGVGKGKTVMTSDERVTALNHGGRLVKVEGRYTRIPHFFSHVAVKDGQLAYQPRVPQMRLADEHQRAESDTTRLGGRPQTTRLGAKPQTTKAVVPPPDTFTNPR